MKYFSFLIFYVAAVIFVGCEEDDFKNSVLQTEQAVTISVSQNSIATCYESGCRNVVITTDSEWNAISEDESWLTVSPESGVGNCDIVVNWSENITKQKRRAVIKFFSGLTMKTITVEQAAKQEPVIGDTAHFVSSRCVIGNMMYEEKDSLELFFDRPIQLIEKGVSNYYAGDWIPDYSDDKKSFKIACPFSKMGIDLKFDYTVASLSDGTKTSGTCDFAFYQNKFILNSENETIRSAIISEDGKSIWISIADICGVNSRVVKLSLEDWSILKCVKIPFPPGHLAYNPYNEQLYVLPCNFDFNYGYFNSFCIVDPDTESIIKSFNIEPSDKTHPQYPAIYPCDLAFTKDGFGILILESSATTELEWRYIDSANDNEITDSGYKKSKFRFEHVYQNFDRTRIYANEFYAAYHNLSYMTREHPQPMTYTIASKFESDYYYAGGNMCQMKFSPFGEKVFISCAPYSQCVVTLEPAISYSAVTGAESRGTRATWDVTHADRCLIYQASDLKNVFWLLDMDNADCVFFCDHIWSDGQLVCMHHIKDTEQLVIVSTSGIWIFDTVYMKQRMKE